MVTAEPSSTAIKIFRRVMRTPSIGELHCAPSPREVLNPRDSGLRFRSARLQAHLIFGLASRSGVILHACALLVATYLAGVFLLGERRRYAKDGRREDRYGQGAHDASFSVLGRNEVDTMRDRCDAGTWHRASKWRPDGRTYRGESAESLTCCVLVENRTRFLGMSPHGEIASP